LVGVTKEGIAKAASGLDLNKYKEHATTQKYSKEDLDNIVSMLCNVIYNDIRFVERKIHTFEWDLKEFEIHGNEKYKNMNAKDKIVFHMKHLNRDQKLGDFGIGNGRMVLDYVLAKFK